jgi:hypothetical protein
MSGPVIHESRFRIELPSRISEGLHKCPSGGRGVPERVVDVGLIYHAGGVGERGD